MKRSEMVSLLRDQLSQLLKVAATHPELIEGHLVRFSDDILALQEQFGMQPPAHQERQYSGYTDEYGNEAVEDVWVQGWEQE